MKRTCRVCACGWSPVFVACCCNRVATLAEHTTLKNAICYESLIGHESPEGYDWPTFDEQSACSLCYTSGTTGQPKVRLAGLPTCTAVLHPMAKEHVHALKGLVQLQACRAGDVSAAPCLQVAAGELAAATRLRQARPSRARFGHRNGKILSNGSKT